MSDIKDFVIEKGALKKYMGNGGDVVIPEGVKTIKMFAFQDSKLMSVVIPDGVTKIEKHAFNGCSNLSSVVIPEGLTGIEEGAFRNCENLTVITIPNSLKFIGGSLIWGGAFEGCRQLKEVHANSLKAWVTIDKHEWGDTPLRNGAVLYCNDEPIRDLVIPAGVTCIGEKAFWRCSSLTSVTIPDSVTSIEEAAFSGCSNLTSVTIPNSVTSIGKNAFLNCVNLTSVTIPDSVTSIEEAAFSGCSNLKNVLIPYSVIHVGRDAFSPGCSWNTEHRFKGNGDIGGPGYYVLTVKTSLPSELTKYNITVSRKELAYIYLYQSGKTWRSWLYNQRLINNPREVLDCIYEILTSENKISKKQAVNLSEFLEKYSHMLSDSDVIRILALLADKKCPAVAQLRDIPGIKRHLADESKAGQGNPIEAFVSERIRTLTPDPRIRPAIKKGIHYANSDELCSIDALIFLIWRYAQHMEWDYRDKRKADLNRYSTYIHLKHDDDADHVAEALDRNELSDLLYNLMNDSFGLYLLPWARFSTDQQITKMIVGHISMSRGRAECDYRGENLYAALYLSDAPAAMQLYDKYGDLDNYAWMRGTTAMELRDSMMLPAFDFDADGVKRYDIGGNTIEVSIAPDLSFRLFDVNKQKEIRSFPKKSDDPAKAEACAKEYAAFKKEVLAFAKQRTELLHKMHMSGEYVGADLWRKVYVEHPVIAKIARLVVWQDETGKTFMITDDGIIDSQSSAYAPQGKIRVAHVLDMNTSDTAAWQQWLAKRGYVQLFEQVWEPVIQYNQDALTDRYSGVTFTNEERNAVKKALKLRGVDMRAEEMNREYNHRTGAWEYSNEGTMLFGDCLRVDYTVDEKTKAIHFGKASSRVKPGSREMNATLLEMDKATLSAQITRDNDAALTDQALSVFSAAQLASLLNLAIDHKATRCTALLLDYKNTHFPEFAEVNEFSLDW